MNSKLYVVFVDTKRRSKRIPIELQLDGLSESGTVPVHIDHVHVDGVSLGLHQVGHLLLIDRLSLLIHETEL